MAPVELSDKNIPLGNATKTLDRLEQLSLVKNFGIAAFNNHVNSVYYKNTEAHVIAKKALLLQPADSFPEMIFKQNIFFLALQKLEQSVEDKILINFPVAETKDESFKQGTVKLNPTLKYKKDGTPVGTRQIVIPHLDEANLYKLRDLEITHGNVTGLYTFRTKRQLKVRAISETEAIRVIEHILKAVIDSDKTGTAKEHTYIGRAPKTVKEGDLHGLKSFATAVDVADLHGVSYRVFI